LSASGGQPMTLATIWYPSAKVTMATTKGVLNAGVGGRQTVDQEYTDPSPAERVHLSLRETQFRQTVAGWNIAVPQFSQTWYSSSFRRHPSQNGSVTLLGDGPGMPGGCGSSIMVAHFPAG
jgi:hypothetical protein